MKAENKFKELYKKRDMKDFVPLPLISTKLSSGTKTVKKRNKKK